jgi:hypothetical protein
MMNCLREKEMSLSASTRALRRVRKRMAWGPEVPKRIHGEMDRVKTCIAMTRIGGALGGVAVHGLGAVCFGSGLSEQSREGMNDGDVQHVHARVLELEAVASGVLWAGRAGNMVCIEGLPCGWGPVGRAGIPRGVTQQFEAGFVGDCHATAPDRTAKNI